MPVEAVEAIQRFLQDHHYKRSDSVFDADNGPTIIKR